jgi:hypothetical protein
LLRQLRKRHFRQRVQARLGVRHVNSEDERKKITGGAHAVC